MKGMISMFFVISCDSLLQFYNLVNERGAFNLVFNVVLYFLCMNSGLYIY